MPVNKRILLVEDEEALSETIALNLRMEGYETDTCSEGNQVMHMFNRKKYDLIILDIMLPGKSGLEICREIRNYNRQVFILFLSARNLPNERIEGLKSGADDYLSKPFSLEELLLRIEILLKRMPATGKSPAATAINLNGRMINFETFEITGLDGSLISLSKKEQQLLRLLIERKNEVVSREEILEKIWGYEQFPSTRTIDNFIVSFRKIFENDARNPEIFISVRGVGYRLFQSGE